MTSPCGAEDFRTSGKDGSVVSGVLLGGQEWPPGVLVEWVSWDWLISRSSSTPDLESQLRSMDNYPDTGG
jgi:hypothetical protein